MDRTHFAETENWKYCSKIIFKCVNSAVGPIFNEKVVEKWSLWDPWTVHLCTVHYWKVKTCGWGGKKKEERNANVDPRLESIDQEWGS